MGSKCFRPSFWVSGIAECAGFLVRGGIPSGSCALVLYGTLRALRTCVARETRVGPVFKTKVIAKGQSKKKKYEASEQTNNQELHPTHIMGT